MDVASTASSNESAGSNPEKRRASMVFPAPGGPMKRALWPPALGQRSQRRGSEDPERDGEVEADPLLAQVSWSEIDRDLLLRQLVPGIAQRGEDARARVVARVVGQADQVEPGQSQRQVHLH